MSGALFGLTEAGTNSVDGQKVAVPVQMLEMGVT